MKKQLVVVRASSLDILFPELGQSLTLRNVSLSGQSDLRGAKKARGKRRKSRK